MSVQDSKGPAHISKQHEVAVLYPTKGREVFFLLRRALVESTVRHQAGQCEIITTHNGHETSDSFTRRDSLHAVKTGCMPEGSRRVFTQRYEQVASANWMFFNNWTTLSGSATMCIQTLWCLALSLLQWSFGCRWKIRLFLVLLGSPMTSYGYLRINERYFLSLALL